MEQTERTFSDRLKRSAYFILTVIGVTLFILLSGLAISQLDNREQVEGKPKNKGLFTQFSTQVKPMDTPESAHYSLAAVAAPRYDKSSSQEAGKKNVAHEHKKQAKVKHKTLGTEMRQAAHAMKAVKAKNR